LIAPSFPAEFPELLDHRQLVGMLKSLGFDYAIEVAFGADLVAQGTENYTLIRTTVLTSRPIVGCSELHPFILPRSNVISCSYCSAMLAIARVVKERYGNSVECVFIGPCVAKKD